MLKLTMCIYHSSVWNLKKMGGDGDIGWNRRRDSTVIGRGQTEIAWNFFLNLEIIKAEINFKFHLNFEKIKAEIACNFYLNFEIIKAEINFKFYLNLEKIKAEIACNFYLNLEIIKAEIAFKFLSSSWENFDKLTRALISMGGGCYRCQVEKEEWRISLQHQHCINACDCWVFFAWS